MKIPLKQISYDGNIRSRMDEAQSEGLAQTMRRVGQQVPVKGIMRDGKCVLVDGMRRYLAACKLGWTELDVEIEPDELGESELLERQLILNVQRADLPIMDKARAVARLMEVSGLKASEAASRLGVSNATVTRLLSLLSLPQEVQQQVARGKLAVSTAYELSRVADVDKRAALMEAASHGKLSRDAATATVKKIRKPRSPSGRGCQSRIVAPIGNGRSVSVSGISASLEEFISCLETALTSARKARTKGISVGTFTKMLRDTTKQQGVQS